MDKRIIGEGAEKQSIRAQAALLAELLADSAEYRQYLAAKARLQCDKEQAYILSQLRQQQMNLRLAQLMGEDVDEEEDDFENLYATFCLEPVICDFLYAEGRLGRLISEVQQIFGGRLEFWSEYEELSELTNRELN